MNQRVAPAVDDPRHVNETTRALRYQWGLAGIVVALGILGLSATAEAKKFTCDGGDVGCLIAAINTANANGKANTITLAAGVFTLTSAQGTDAEQSPVGLPLITGTLTIDGAGAADTVIERDPAAAQFRLLTVLGDLTINGLTLRGGDSVVHGGAILAIGTLAVTNSVVTGNHAREGGGLEIRGPATISNSTIAANSAIEGAGLYAAGNASVVNVAGSTFAKNVGTFGGAIDVLLGATVMVTNSTFYNNGAFTGSAINEGIAADAPIMPNTVPPGTATITHSTMVANNTNTIPFGGRTINSRVGTIRVGSTIIANSLPVGADCPRSATSLGANLIGDATGCPTFLVPGDLTGDPGLDDVADDGGPGQGYFPLLSNSPAIDAGETANGPADTACPPRDQIGQPRVGPCDIGAIEFQPPEIVTIQQSQFDKKTGVLFVSARSSGSRAVTLFVTVADCLADTAMLRLGQRHLLLTQPRCGGLDNHVVTVTSSSGGSATAPIR
jgi:hypothetical protein